MIVIGFVVSVDSHSANFSMDDLEKRLRKCVSDEVQSLGNISTVNFNKLKLNAVRLKDGHSTSLDGAVASNWREIVTRACCFKRSSEEVNEIRKLTAADVQQWCLDLNNNATCRQLVIQIHAIVVPKTVRV